MLGVARSGNRSEVPVSTLAGSSFFPYPVAMGASKLPAMVSNVVWGVVGGLGFQEEGSVKCLICQE